jgi:hypothetical protein
MIGMAGVGPHSLHARAAARGLTIGWFSSERNRIYTSFELSNRDLFHFFEARCSV